MRVVIVGGGVAGLATARQLRKQAAAKGETVSLTVLEAREKAGGNVITDHLDDGWHVDWGPNGFLDNAEDTITLCRELGVEDELQRAGDAYGDRFLFRYGKMIRLPMSPPEFFKSPVVTGAAKLSMLGEPFRKRLTVEDQTVAEFVENRLGREFLDYLVQPMVSGVFAGDAERLSLKAAFAKMDAMEVEYGGLIKAMLGKMREKRAEKKKRERGEGGPAGPAGILTSFKHGFGRLTDRLIEDAGETLVTSMPVESVIREGEGLAVLCQDGSKFEADKVVLSCPAPVAAKIVENSSASAAAGLSQIFCAPLALLALGWPDDAFEKKPEGFGVLLPRVANIRTLGVLFTSSIFPGQAPEGHSLVRAMMGGMTDPTVLDQTDEEIINTFKGDLKKIIGEFGEPTLERLYRFPSGIPQYQRHHLRDLGEIEKALDEDLPGTFLTGNSYRGISVNYCVTDAVRLAGVIGDD